MLYYETELPKGALTKRFFSNNLFKATLVKTQSEEFQKISKKKIKIKNKSFFNIYIYISYIYIYIFFGIYTLSIHI